MTKTFKIAVIPGDGVGKEVVKSGVDVLQAVADNSKGEISFDFTYYPWGSDYYLEHGVMMDPEGVEELRQYDAIYFGAVGDPRVPDHVTLWGLRIQIVQNLDQWANVRPVDFLPGTPKLLNRDDLDKLNWITVRENSEGEYSGIGGRNFSARPENREIAVQTSVFTAYGVERIIRFAFELAKSRKRKKVTSVTKSNAQQYALVMWDEIFKKVSQEYPNIETNSILIDAMAARMVMHPEDMDVIVSSNLFGDILSDLGSALAGSLGIASSGNLNPEKKTPSMFESVHGSAIDIAGQGIANPIGTIDSGAMMLEHFGLEKEAEAVHKAVRLTTSQGVLTQDLGGTATTEEITARIIENTLKELEK